MSKQNNYMIAGCLSTLFPDVKEGIVTEDMLLDKPITIDGRKVGTIIKVDLENDIFHAVVDSDTYDKIFEKEIGVEVDG